MRRHLAELEGFIGRAVAGSKDKAGEGQLRGLQGLVPPSVVGRKVWARGGRNRSGEGERGWGGNGLGISVFSFFL